MSYHVGLNKGSGVNLGIPLWFLTLRKPCVTYTSL